MRLIDADKIVYSWRIDADGEEHDGVTLESIIKKMPTIEERKMGKWEYVDYGGFGNWHCTACREICICNGDYDYCPYCGAKMDVERKEE